ncbi:MAG: lytic transglycosylase domain-containing protein [Ruminococcaceae bacterium]|nr:lytic transglycosylase domain-containing protein [Oscillospiraceae bacterium]
MKIVRRILVFILIIAISAGFLYSVMKAVFPLKHENYIEVYSCQYNIDPYLIMGIIKAESNFEHDAVSSKNASGLMQITKSTAEWIADELGINNFEYKRDIISPEINIKMGCFYMDYLLSMYSGREKCALAAYNAGFNNVDSWLLNDKWSKDGKTLDKIPFPETEKYVSKVSNYRRIYEFLYGDVFN